MTSPYFRWAMSQDHPNDSGAIWKAFLKGYRSQHELKGQDLEAVPLFVTARRVWMGGIHAHLVSTDGYGWMDDTYFDRAFELLRADVQTLFGSS